jgi:hypothetical protein
MKLTIQHVQDAADGETPMEFFHRTQFHTG